MTSRPLAADLCSEQGAGVGTESRKQEAESRKQAAEIKVRCEMRAKAVNEEIMEQANRIELANGHSKMQPSAL